MSVYENLGGPTAVFYRIEKVNLTPFLLNVATAVGALIAGNGTWPPRPRGPAPSIKAASR